jgi:AraC family transcriptional regulator, transcriptional activator of pobA
LKSTIKEIPVYGIDSFVKNTKNVGAYEVKTFEVNRNYPVAYPHRHHDFYELLFITQGTGNHAIDGHDFVIKPNSIFFLSPGQIHDLNLSADVQGYIFLFSSAFYHFNKSDPYKLFELPFFYDLSASNLPIYLSKSADIELITNYFQKSIAESQQNLSETDEVIRAYLDLLLIFCKRIYPTYEATESHNKSKILVKRFKQLIEQNCQKNWSIYQYANELGISQNHLSETVKSVTGHTSTDLVNDRMLLEIKRLLINTDLSISEIAYQLNFTDQSYFSKYFKRLAGATPGEFRRF